MTVPDYTQKLSKIRTRISRYARAKNTSVVYEKDKSPFNLFGFALGSYVLYIIPPIAIFILLLIFQSCKSDYIDKDNVVKKKTNYKKLLMYTLAGGIIVNIAIFAYLHKKSRIL